MCASHPVFCEESNCSSCGLGRIGAFESPNYCKCTCHPENLDKVRYVIDEKSAREFLEFVILKRIGKAYKPRLSFRVYKDSVWDEDGNEQRVRSFDDEQVAILDRENSSVFRILGLSANPYIRLLREKLPPIVVDARFDEVTEKAIEAFWEVVSDHFAPEIEVGDEDPSTSFALEQAARTAIRHWYENNKPSA